MLELRFEPQQTLKSVLLKTVFYSLSLLSSVLHGLRNRLYYFPHFTDEEPEANRG